MWCVSWLSFINIHETSVDMCVYYCLLDFSCNVHIYSDSCLLVEFFLQNDFHFLHYGRHTSFANMNYGKLRFVWHLSCVDDDASCIELASSIQRCLPLICKICGETYVVALSDDVTDNMRALLNDLPLCCFVVLTVDYVLCDAFWNMYYVECHVAENKLALFLTDEWSN